MFRQLLTIVFVAGLGVSGCAGNGLYVEVTTELEVKNPSAMGDEPVETAELASQLAELCLVEMGLDVAGLKQIISFFEDEYMVSFELTGTEYPTKFVVYIDPDIAKVTRVVRSEMRPD